MAVTPARSRNSVSLPSPPAATRAGSASPLPAAGAAAARRFSYAAILAAGGEGRFRPFWTALPPGQEVLVPPSCTLAANRWAGRLTRALLLGEAAGRHLGHGQKNRPGGGDAAECPGRHGYSGQVLRP